MDHDTFLGPTEVDRRSFFGMGAVLAGGLGASALGATRTSGAGNDPYVGELLLVPYNFAPRGFAFCEGQTLPISQNQALFALIGIRFGGDGRSTFKLPDTRRAEEEMAKTMGTRGAMLRYVISLIGTFPSRS
jgi:microcystin-dependent protein